LLVLKRNNWLRLDFLQIKILPILLIIIFVKFDM
jgi:hypothetical protein